MARQAIKYQTTTVEPVKSAGEIQVLVQRYGGTRCEVRWDERGRVVGIRFAVRHERFGEVPVRLTAKIDRIKDILWKETSMAPQRREEQAYRIAWRQLKDVTEQLLLAVETGLFAFHEAFMAAVETEDPASGEVITWGELLERYGSRNPSGFLQLGPGAPVIEAEVIEIDGGRP